MKTIKFTSPFVKSNLLKTVLIATAVFSLYSCSNEQKSEDSKEVAEKINEEKFDSNDKKEKDSEFLVKAAEINIKEIQLGQLAVQNGVTSDVKELGKMMEVEHKKCLAELTVLAAKKVVTIPTTPSDDTKDTYEKLSAKTGKDFDKEYTDKMVDGHKDAIDLFEKASTDSEDAEVKEWAKSTLPNLRKHLEHALMCQKKFENNK